MKKSTDLQPHLAALSGLLSAGGRLRPAIHAILEDHFNRSGDLATAADGLSAMLEDPEPYLREYAAKLLAQWFVRKKNIDGLRSLLRREKDESLYSTAGVLREKRFDLTPLLPDLVAIADHPKSCVRESVSTTLVAFSKKSPETVLKALGSTKAAAEIRTKIEKG